MRTLVGVWIALACLPACAPEDILVAKTPLADAGDGNKPDGAAQTAYDASTMQSDCSSNAECEPQDYCAKSRCDSAQGTCTSRPTLCDSAQRPVCGCDGVNYFNDCLRRASGIASARDGECGESATPCGLTEDDGCPNDGYCGVLMTTGQYCLADPPGTCWVLPAECDQNGTGEDRFMACDETFGSGGPVCVDACRAIRSEKQYVRAQLCPR